ncbi:hypothetical protein LXL04_025930 [Taraxacum kok-saghyz]
MLSNSAPWSTGNKDMSSITSRSAECITSKAFPINPATGNTYLATSVMHADFWSFAEIMFQNWEDTVQSWHIDSYSFFVVGMDGGQWTPGSRTRYNLRDTVTSGCGTSDRRIGVGSIWGNNFT